MSNENYFKKKIDALRKQAKPIGEGGQKEIYDEPDSANKVVGVYYEESCIEDGTEISKIYDNKNPEELKDIFYMTKIARLLFPDNVAQVYQVTTDPPTITKRKIVGNVLDWTNLSVQDERDFDFLLEKMAQVGILVDSVPENTMRDEQGNLVYIDDIEPMDHPKFNNWQRLRDAIDKLDPDKKVKAETYLRQLSFKSTLYPGSF